MYTKISMFYICVHDGHCTWIHFNGIPSDHCPSLLCYDACTMHSHLTVTTPSTHHVPYSGTSTYKYTWVFSAIVPSVGSQMKSVVLLYRYPSWISEIFEANLVALVVGNVLKFLSVIFQRLHSHAEPTQTKSKITRQLLLDDKVSPWIVQLHLHCEQQTWNEEVK